MAHRNVRGRHNPSRWSSAAGLKDVTGTAESAVESQTSASEGDRVEDLPGPDVVRRTPVLFFDHLKVDWSTAGDTNYLSELAHFDLGM
jgi:hypothetical protein